MGTVGRVLAFVVLCIVYQQGWAYYENVVAVQRINDAVLSGFQDGGQSAALARTQGNLLYGFGWFLLGGFGIVLFRSKAVKMWRSLFPVLMLGLMLSATGCNSNPFMRPMAPVKLEQIGANEEGFLIPYLGDTTAQSNNGSEELLRKNVVNVKQVRVPQQWVPLGYEWMTPNGHWLDAAILIKVDRSPVTCIWTADPNSGTGKGNEAVWVMTSDQVEFSTGWTCTARIANQKDCIKFLYNYPNGSIKSVMDREVRALVQTAFSLEVTDQPMSKLRSDATPHIQTVIKKVTDFFTERGLTITNLGISGGFIYTDKKISDRMTELFVAEQGEAVATAEANGIKKKAQGAADAAKTKAQGEADAIKTVAEAKAFEIEKAKENLETYLALKRLEVDKLRLEKWDGKFPQWFSGSSSPDILLNMAAPAVK